MAIKQLSPYLFFKRTRTMALHDTFWGARFGTLVDRHGIHCLFTCEKKG